MSTSNLRKLKELLTKNKIIDHNFLKEAEKEALKSNQDLETLLLAKNLIKNERLG